MNKISLKEILEKKEEKEFNPIKVGFDKFVKVEHMDANKLKIKRYGSISKDLFPPTFYHVFRKGQILFPTRNPHLRRTALAEIDGICGEKTLTLQPVNTDKILSEIIPFIFQSDKFIQHCNDSIVGSTNPHVRWRDIEQYSFNLPSKQEQIKILNQLTALEEGINNSEQLIETLEKMGRVLFNQLVKKENFPKKKLGEFIKFQQKSKRRAGDGLDVGKYLFFTSSQIQNKFLDSCDYDGEFLIMGTGGSPSLHYINDKFSTSADSFVIATSDNLTAKYAYYFLFYNMNILEEGFVGGALKHISKQYISEISINIPDIKMQEKISRLLDLINDLKQKVQLNLRLQERIKRRTLNENF